MDKQSDKRPPLDKALAAAEISKVTLANKEGKLLTDALHDFARRNKKSYLHSRLTWDDSEAAYKWRITELQTIIQAVVIIMPHEPIEYRKYVSIHEDRYGNKGGGYRDIQTVSDNPKLRADVIADAVKEVEVFAYSFQQRYGWLKEVKPLVAALMALIKRFRKAA